MQAHLESVFNYDRMNQNLLISIEKTNSQTLYFVKMFNFLNKFKLETYNLKIRIAQKKLQFQNQLITVEMRAMREAAGGNFKEICNGLIENF